MKSTIAYYFILLYSIVMLHPLIPIGKDFIAHSFFETIHIATVHALYGSNHLQKEIAENSDDVNNKTHKKTTVEETQIQVHISFHEILLCLNDQSCEQGYLFQRLWKPSSGFISTYFPPPDIV